MGLVVPIVGHHMLSVCRAVKLNDQKTSGARTVAAPASVQCLRHNRYIVNSNNSCKCVWNHSEHKAAQEQSLLDKTHACQGDTQK